MRTELFCYTKGKNKQISNVFTCAFCCSIAYQFFFTRPMKVHVLQNIGLKVATKFSNVAKSTLLILTTIIALPKQKMQSYFYLLPAIKPPLVKQTAQGCPILLRCIQLYCDSKLAILCFHYCTTKYVFLLRMPVILFSMIMHTLNASRTFV